MCVRVCFCFGSNNAFTNWWVATGGCSIEHMFYLGTRLSLNLSYSQVPKKTTQLSSVNTRRVTGHQNGELYVFVPFNLNQKAVRIGV